MKRIDVPGFIASLPSSTRGALLLGIAVLSATVLLSVINAITEQRIATATAQLRMDSISAVLPPGPFDNNPIDSLKQHAVPSLGGGEALDVYTVYTSGQPRAAVLEILAPDGYSGNIRLLLGLEPDGTIVAARVIEHKETPGLGDAIDIRRSQWIIQFAGRSLDKDHLTQWQLGQSSTQIDAITGATITSRAVLHAIHRALLWFEVHHEQLFQQ